MISFNNFEFKLRKKFGFFYVKEEYVKFLKNVDPNVCDNYSEERAYIGILIQVNGHDYLAPLTSPGKDYLNNKKYRRIVHPINDSKNGWVRVGNMIPVTKEVIYPVIISQIDNEFYRNVLLEQFQYLRKEYVIKEIRNLAYRLYFKRYEKDDYYLANILCNYKLLEKKCTEYKSSL